MSDVSRPVRHATPQVRTLPVLLAILALFALVAIALIVSAGLLELFFGTVSIPEPSRPDLPAPQLQTDPTMDLIDLRQRDRQRLNAGAAVPIERAMEIVTERGSAAYDPWIAAPGAQGAQPP